MPEAAFPLHGERHLSRCWLPRHCFPTGGRKHCKLFWRLAARFLRAAAAVRGGSGAAEIGFGFRLTCQLANSNHKPSSQRLARSVTSVAIFFSRTAAATLLFI